MADLCSHSVPGLEGAYYWRDWLPQEVADLLADKISKQEKLQEWQLYHPGPLIDGYETDKSEVQDFFKPVLKRLEDEGLLINPFQYNFNTYTPPNYCIMPHRDSCGSRVAILSLLSSSVLEFFYSDTPVYAAFLFMDELPAPTARLLMEPNSLVVLSGPAFFKHMHGIQPMPSFIIDSNINNIGMTKYGELDLSTPIELEKKKRIAIPVWSNQTI